MRIRHPGLWIGAAIFLVALILLLFVFRVFDNSASHSMNHPEYPAQYGVLVFEDQTPPLGSGMRHLNPGETVRYNSNPPSNGRHSPRTVPWGVSPEPVPPEEALHNMEHGGVIVWYNCDGGPQPLDEPACDQLLRDLTQLVEPRVDDGMYILVTPYTTMDNRIALTAWQYVDAFEEFDQARIEGFIASFECRYDPERACR